MITFKHLIIQNFMALEQVIDYDLSDKATRLLLGRNLDSTAADDNGSGKSSFAEAIKWALYGETTRQAIDKSLTVEHVIREGEKKAVVDLTFEDGDNRYVVRRERTMSSHKLHVDVIPLLTSKGSHTTYTGKEAQDVINGALGIDVIQFSNLVLLDGAYPLLFAPSSDRTRKDILSDLVDMAVAAETQEFVGKKLVVADTKCTQLGMDIARLDVSITQYTEQMRRAKAEAKAELKKSKAMVAEVEDLKGDLSKMAEQLEMAEDKLEAFEVDAAEDLDALEKEYDLADQAVVNANAHLQKVTLHYNSSEIDEARERLHSSEQDHALLTKQISKIESLRAKGKCPTCGQETQAAHEGDLTDYQERSKEAKDAIHRDRRALEELESERKRALDTATLDVEKAITERDAVRGAIRDAKVKSKPPEALSKAVDEAEIAYNNTKRLKEQTVAKIKTSRALIDRAKKEHTVAKNAKKDAEDRRDELQLQLAQAVIVRDNLEFWKKGFGPKGVPSLFIETVLPRISARIQKYANILTGGDLTVSLRAFKETKSKTVQESIQISAVNSKGSSVYGANSTGERNRINLAVTLGLIEYFRDMGVFESNLLICDEIFDGLDRTGVQQALYALEEAEMGHVIVISHHEHLKPLFPEVMRVTKENGAATLEGN
jgi:DNA repair exonuclease SbcCD ATPase subunit